MNKNTALLVSGFIFGLVSLAHLLRVIFKIEIVISSYMVPYELSIFGCVVFLLLSIWMFVARKSKK